MHRKQISVGDLHADLWDGLRITHRRVEGPEDVTVGEHAELGLCVVSHQGCEDQIEWFTQRPVDRLVNDQLAPTLMTCTT
jgi:hypothetical protein